MNEGASSELFTIKGLWNEKHTAVLTNHWVKIPVFCRPQRHPDYPRSCHHTLYHKLHPYTLLLCLLIADLWRSNSLGRCSHSGRMLCHYQPAASSHPQCIWLWKEVYYIITAHYYHDNKGTSTIKQNALYYVHHSKEYGEQSAAQQHLHYLQLYLFLLIVHNNNHFVWIILFPYAHSHMIMGEINIYDQEFITVRVCNSHMVSTPTIWIGWHSNQQWICLSAI